MNYHQAIGIGAGIAGSFLIFFSLVESIRVEGLCIYLYSFGSCYISVFISICIMESFKGPIREKFLFLVHGSFGLGGLVGPIIVYLLELNTFTFIGFLICCLAPFFWWKSSP